MVDSTNAGLICSIVSSFASLWAGEYVNRINMEAFLWEFYRVVLSTMGFQGALALHFFANCAFKKQHIIFCRGNFLAPKLGPPPHFFGLVVGSRRDGVLPHQQPLTKCPYDMAGKVEQVTKTQRNLGLYWSIFHFSSKTYSRNQMRVTVFTFSIFFTSQSNLTKCKLK